jgi:hypothetical protein
MAKVKHPKITERIGIYADKKLVSMAGEGRHIKEHYVVVSDKKVGKKRVITLEVQDRREVDRKKKELLEAILVNMGDQKNKTVRALVADVLNDYTDSSIDDLHNRVVTKKQPVKAQEGCFKLVIGDGRKKGHKEIMIRE